MGVKKEKMKRICKRRRERKKEEERKNRCKKEV